MKTKGLILTFSFILIQDLVRKATAETCGYVTPNGMKRYTFCMQKCCDKNEKNYHDVCCPYGDTKEVYMGAGMATLIVLSVFAVCFTYVCCKQRMRGTQRAPGRARPWYRSSRSRDRNQNVIPTVSLQVEPIQPPAYDALPPPYYEPGSSNKKEELSTSEYGPPPAYTP